MHCHTLPSIPHAPLTSPFPLWSSQYYTLFKFLLVPVVAAYIFFLVFLSLLSFLQYPVSEGSAYTRCDQASLSFTVHRMSLSNLTLRNTSSLLTWSVQLIFSVFLQHHVSKLSRYFWSTFWSVQVSAPNKPILQMQHFSSLNLSPVCWWKESSSCSMLLLQWQSWI